MLTNTPSPLIYSDTKCPIGQPLVSAKNNSLVECYKLSKHRRCPSPYYCSGGVLSKGVCCKGNPIFETINYQYNISTAPPLDAFLPVRVSWKIWRVIVFLGFNCKYLQSMIIFLVSNMICRKRQIHHPWKLSRSDSNFPKFI